MVVADEVEEREAGREGARVEEAGRVAVARVRVRWGVEPRVEGVGLVGGWVVAAEVAGASTAEGSGSEVCVAVAVMGADMEVDIREARAREANMAGRGVVREVWVAVWVVAVRAAVLKEVGRGVGVGVKGG